MKHPLFVIPARLPPRLPEGNEPSLFMHPERKRKSEFNRNMSYLWV